MDTKEQLIALLEENFPDCHFDIFFPHLDGDRITVKMYNSQSVIASIETDNWSSIIPYLAKEYEAFSVSQVFTPLPFDRLGG